MGLADKAFNLLHVHSLILHLIFEYSIFFLFLSSLHLVKSFRSKYLIQNTYSIVVSFKRFVIWCNSNYYV